MKRIISILTLFAVLFTIAACGKKPSDAELSEDNKQEVVMDDVKTENEENVNNSEEKTENKKEEDKVTETKPEVKPETKPEVKPEAKPEVKPEEKPEVKPEAKPETKPEAKPEENKSVGNALLGEFKTIATSTKDALSIAEKLASSKNLSQISAGAIAVEEGYLTGFDNAEIKGFKEGAMFAPMIGTIPFVGYVFVLADGQDAASFISTLKSSANLRWNICTSADEMIAGNVGNKVFFVMSPLKFEE